MPRGKHLSIEIKQRVVNLFLSGQKQSFIAKNFNLNKSIVSRIIKQYRQIGNVCVKKASGRPRKTTKHHDKQIIKMAKEDPFDGLNRLKGRIEAELGVTVCSRTVRGRLVEG